MRYRFTGDEDDPLTWKWGLKKHGVYEVEKKKNKYGRGIVATIDTPKMGKVQCHYDSENVFGRNWKVTY